MPEEAAVAEAPPQSIELSATPRSLLAEALSTGEEEAPVTPLDPIPEPSKPTLAPVKEEKTPEPDIEAPKLPEGLFGIEPEPKKEVVKVESEPVKEETPAELKGKARENFERLSTAKHEAEKKAFAAEKRLKDLEAKAEEGDPGAKAKIKQLEEQLNDYSQRVSVADVRLHPEFQRNFQGPRDQALEFAKTTYADAGGDPKVLESALQLKGRARADRLDEIYGDITSKSLLGKLERAVDFVEAKDTEIEGVLKNSGEYGKHLKEQDLIRQSEFDQQKEQQIKKDLGEASKLLAGQFDMAIFKRTDDPNFGWWNEQIDTMDKEAEHLMLKTPDLKELAIASKLAVAAPRLYKMFIEEHKARLASDKRFRDYKGGEPGLGGEGKPDGSTDEVNEDEPLEKSIIRSIRSKQAR